MDDQLPRSSDSSTETPSEPVVPTTPSPLAYEETPILEPVAEPPANPSPPLDTSTELPDPLTRHELPSESPRMTSSAGQGGGMLRKLIAIIILFGVGLFGSIFVHNI